ncbi:MAG: MtrB/PioB family decaheme-associated outer membrane protein [Steroidobacteraceae bacterium]|nr:MtrB/PioB family decaheme-associated outer membrane protein [Steroidobacteraceae bacterium]
MRHAQSKHPVNPMETRSFLITLAVASVLSAAGAAAADVAAAPDTSEWTCSKCPYDRGYRSEVELGGAYVDEDAAKFGDYTGLDEKGGYVIANAEGRASEESGYVLEYELTDLGLDSREARLAGGKQGQYEFEVSYDAIPHRIWDTTATPFSGNGSGNLTLPSGWVDAGYTGGMTTLDSSLRNVDVGFDRDRYGAAGKFWFSENLKFDLDYRRDQRDGTRTQLASFGSASTQLLRPVDDATDRIDATLRYQGKNWYLQAGYFGSIYDTQAASLRWDNPFTAMVPGANVGQMALMPDNQYHEFAVTAGWFGLPGHTTVALSLASGEGTQDTGYLPYTSNPQLATDALPARNLDGQMSVTRADITLTSRPMEKLRLRGSVAYDERDNDTKQRTWTSIVHTDLFPVLDDRVNPVYGFERLRVFGSADYEVYDQLTVGAGGEFRTLDRTGSAQEVKSEELADGWGSLQYRPTGFFGVVLKGGAMERTPDKYEADAAGSGQNPLLRKYNQAYLYRSYGEGIANLTLGSLPITLGANAFYGDDSYTLSTIGATTGLDRRYGVDVTWAMNDKLSLYASAGEEKIDAKRQGSQAFAQPDWRWVLEDNFETYGAGLRAQPAEKLAVDLDYTYAKGTSRTELVGVNGGSFPANRSEFSTLRADVTYAMSERVDLAVTWRYETFESSDWALQGIDPATLGNVLALGADPYDYDVNYVGASVRYYFGSRKLALPE